MGHRNVGPDLYYLGGERSEIVLSRTDRRTGNVRTVQRISSTETYGLCWETRFTENRAVMSSRSVRGPVRTSWLHLYF